MCTAIHYFTKDHYFGRNLDYEVPFDTSVTIMPRSYTLSMRNGNKLNNRYAMIGMALVTNAYPLYFDATNEKGLSIAGLNFPKNAVYNEPVKGKYNITPFELTPWLLGNCANIPEAEAVLSQVNLTNISFSKTLPLTPLHWLIADKDSSIVLESTNRGLEIYPNPIGVLTNNPTFDYHLLNLNNYLNITANEPANHFSEKINLSAYSRGMGGFGLPGDLSSSSRFVRAAFTKLNSVCGDSEEKSVSQFFHILGSVVQQRGCVKVDDRFEITLYTSCCNMDKGIYYYKTYENNQVTAVRMRHEDKTASSLITYPMRTKQSIFYEN